MFQVDSHRVILFRPCSAMTRSLTPDDAFRFDLRDINQQSVFGVEIIPHDPLSEIQAFGVVPTMIDGELSFVAMTFHDVDEVASTETVFPGVPVGDVPTLGGTYQPSVGVQNFSNQNRIVAVLQAHTDGDHSTFTEVDQVSVAPLSVMSFKISHLRDSAGATNSFVIKADGKPGDVQTQLWSQSEKGKAPMVFAAKDAKDEHNGGIHPWTLRNRSSDSLYLFNQTDMDQPVHLKINNRVAVWTKTITLSPHESKSISLRKLAEDEQLDDMNTPFSTGLGEGEISWYTNDAGRVKGRLQHIDMQSHLVTSFQCQAYYVYCGINPISGPSTVNVGSTSSYSSGNAVLCINSLSPGICSGSPSGSTSAAWQWSGFGHFSLQGSSTQPSVSLKAATPGTDTLSVMATSGSCLFYQSQQVQVKQPCPSSISVANRTVFNLSSFSQYVPNSLLTGIGMVSTMQVGPSSTNWNNTVITESLATLQNSCPTTSPWPNPCTGSGNFTVGTGGTAKILNTITLATFNPLQNDFYDQHTLASSFNLLQNPGVSSCTIVCSQTYTCGGNSVGSFTVTYDLAPGTVSSNPVSNVTVSKY